MSSVQKSLHINVQFLYVHTAYLFNFRLHCSPLFRPLFFRETSPILNVFMWLASNYDFSDSEVVVGSDVTEQLTD